ncbi:T9SS type B sorting domain-containing protein [Flavobacterium selenitireducens]|uniref:T9SS type B sorting domain-containing protein n=1 Tax=Flavobacterium selenitireducens TaxID=2722704 RepID=UPI00168A71E5|nr:gliding motility-associated C-terminal domain-containing protein [Flavobacterium selenitireducens]MBD3581538.1 T9SS type B sorting domain-containing protein [Flavobacterium selenitireducens]
MKYFYGLLLFLFSTYSFSQCLQIESILVDACGPEEGLNEMVRFRVGNAALNTSNLNVNWPNNDWEGLVQNGVTASKVAALNADILAAGGCGQLLQPTNGVLPANAVVILVTSFNFDTSLNQFGPITDTIYMLFQNNPSTTSGHFANSGTGMRTLQVSFGDCSDSVTYNRALLIDQNGAQTAGDGATVQFTPGGQATYINNGCSAPVPPFTVDAGAAPLTACAGSQINLNGSAQGQQSVQWTAASGTFSAASNLSTTYTLSPQATGAITLTLTGTNSCGATVSDIIIVNVTPAITPNFQTQLTLCQGATAPVLATTSPNGISGTWNPATINNQASGTYTFTPTAGQCAIATTLSVTITNGITPNFQTQLTLCQGATAPVLATTSPNGISGTWNPATINNQASGTYTFTPNAGQCAIATTLSVTITNSVAPDFQTQFTLCQGATAPVLATTSPNGISGTWNPATINNQASGTYTFTPNAGQCAIATTLSVTITNGITPNFQTQLTLCQDATAPVLATTSPNGISGTWNPATINNQASGTYTFTPNAGQCAIATTLSVTITNSVAPDFQTQFTLCQGAAAPVLATTSPNGISGTWNPATINNQASGTYTFTPNAGQCAIATTLSVTITNSVAPDFQTQLTLCQGATASVLETTSPNGISGTWNPAMIDNQSSGIYVFTPTAGQCAQAVTLTVTLSNPVIRIDQFCESGDYMLQLNADGISDPNPEIEWTDASGVVIGNSLTLNLTDVIGGTSVSFPAVFNVSVRLSSGCELTDSATVNGIFCTIPKGVSPNGDGANDDFDLSGLDVSELKIFNRYGLGVFSKRNYTKEWHGQSDNGNELPDGTYYYALTTTSGKVRTGWVYLIRKA